MRKNKLLAMAAVCTLLSGCASMHHSYDGYDVSRIDPFIELNTTTLDEVRALLGTPTLLAKAEDGNTVAGFALLGSRPGGAYGRNVGKGLLTFGLGSKTYEYTQKNVLFKFDSENKVTDYQKNGWSYLWKARALLWVECERQLTEAEMNQPINYTVDEICQVYAEEVAAKKGIDVSEVDTGEEFEACNIACHTERDATEKFGKLSEVTKLVEKKEGDGQKFELIFPAKM